MSAPDEFEQIARLYRPLTRGAAGAFGLLDDAAVVSQRPGCDLVVTKDAIVEGVHFPPATPLDLVARKLVRVNLSDLAAKGAEPDAYFLAVAWSDACAWKDRQAFAEGLRQDGEAYGLTLLGGDTASTPGPLTLSLTLLGWVPTGRMIRRSGALPGDLLMVSGTIGDGTLGLAAEQGEVSDPDGFLTARFRLPNPRLDLRDALRGQAHAACDVSDGLIADARHIAEASGTGLHINLDRLPMSNSAGRWLSEQSDLVAGRLRLATGGDDYEVVCAAAAPIRGFTVLGEFTADPAVVVTAGGVQVDPGPGGWRHR